MTHRWPRVVPEGDRGLLVEFPPELSPEINALVRGAHAGLAGLPGVVESVPTFRSLLLIYDPSVVTFAGLAERAEVCARTIRPAPANAGSLLEVPVVYGGPAGPDLADVAAACGLTEEEVVRLHAEPIYLVYMLGFAPGYPYLGLLPPALRLPRRATPRTRVPAGSIAIADAFAGIYPQETPGGWHLLGRTPLRLFDPARTPACLLRPGDHVRFIPVTDAAVAESALRDAAREAAQRPLPAPHRPTFEVLEPGLMSTVQDLGRTGWRGFGIPLSGVLDRRALRAANAAAGNPPAAAAVELTFPGPKLRLFDDSSVAVAGADLDARVNGTPINPEEPVQVRRGDVLSFAAPRRGQWLYLSVAGGIDVPEVFGSRSTFARGGLGGTAGRPLRAGDVLGRGETRSGSRRTTPVDDAGRSGGPIRVIMGPQADAFAVDAQAALISRPFEVTVQRDRSGMRLSGTTLTHRDSAEILSDGLVPGAIQVPADGGPVVILADGPTTGGYAKIATVIDADLDRVAQAVPGEALRFDAVTVEEAQAAGAAAGGREDIESRLRGVTRCS